MAKADYGNGKVVTYTYDKAGNLLIRSVTGSASAGVITSVNVAGSPASAGIVQNGWIEIHGNNLVPANTAATGVIWSTAPEFAQGRMPTQLNGINVTVNNKPAFVYFFCSAATDASCASDQINVLTPLDSTIGNVPIVVTSGTSSSAPFSANMVGVVPSFLLFTAQGYVAATHADYSLIGPTALYPGASTPATSGETVLVFGVGFGLPSQPITVGSSTQNGTLTNTPVCRIGGANATVSSAALISPGLYQFNIVVPSGVGAGDNAIACTYSGASTPSGDLLTIR